MDVVSPELNSLLPDEIMDTEAMEEAPHSQPDSAAVQAEPCYDSTVPMETDVPQTPSVSEDAAPTGNSQTQLTPTDSTLSPSRHSSILISSGPSRLVTLKPGLATSTAPTKTTDSVTGTSMSTGGLQKLTAPFTISSVNHQIILNKVASSQAAEAAKSAGPPPQVIKQEGQKLLVTTIGKSGQPIVLQLPHAASKPGVVQASGDGKAPAPQFKVVTIAGGSELKPVVGSGGNQVTAVQTQQLKTIQVTLSAEAATVTFELPLAGL